MFFYKQTFSDPNENVFYSVLRNLKSLNIYRPDIKYAYNYDVQNYFG